MKKTACEAAKIVLLSTLLISALAGCWDKVEIEQRAFVISLGIDKAKEDDGAVTVEGTNQDKRRFSVALAMPNLDAMDGKDGGDKDASKWIKTSSNETFTSAIRLTDTFSSKKLYFGHTKVSVLGSEILGDEQLFRETIDALERNQEISRKLIVLASQKDAKGILDAKVNGEPTVGAFVSNFYQNNANTVALTFRLDLEELIRRLRTSGDVVIPKVQEKDKELELCGAAVMKNFKLAGWLTALETRGYLWLRGDAEGAQLVTTLGDAHVPLRVNKSKGSLFFWEENGQLHCQLNAKLEGAAEEYIFSSEDLDENDKLARLTQQYQDAVAQEMLNTANIFQKQYKVDGFGLKEHLRKHNYALFQKVQNNWDEAYANMIITAQASVRITSTGSIK